jgi:hypothetical protein
MKDGDLAGALVDRAPGVVDGPGDGAGPHHDNGRLHPLEPLRHHRLTTLQADDLGGPRPVLGLAAHSLPRPQSVAVVVEAALLEEHTVLEDARASLGHEVLRKRRTGFA